MDFVVSSGRTVIGIEVKAGSRFGDRDLAGVLAYTGTEALSVGKYLYAIPMSLLLS